MTRRRGQVAASIRADFVRATLLSVALLCGCEEAPPAGSLFQVDIAVVDDRGGPVAGAGITLGEEALGTTGGSGHLQATLRGHRGDRHRMQVRCPNGHGAAEGADDLQFLDLQGLDGQALDHFERRILCPRLQRTIAILVQSDLGAGLPIVVDGQRLSHLGAGGLAHLRLDAPMHTRHEIEIDSSSRPALVPRSPVLPFRVDERDDLLVFRPAFESVAPTPHRSHHPRRQAKQPPRRPVRID